MQFDDAQRLSRNHKNKNCTHENIEKEYYLGSQTGDYVCTSCGKTFSSKSEWEAEREEILKNKKQEEQEK